MKHFDLHCHPSLKTFLGSYKENERKNCWKELKFDLPMTLINRLTGRILESQSSLSQLKNGGFNIIVAALYSLEHPMIVGSIAKTTNLEILSERIDELSHTLFENMVEVTPGFGYHDVLESIKHHLLNSQSVNGYSFNLVSKFSDIKENQLNIILAIEGAHALYNDPRNYTKQEILDNLSKIKNSPNRYLYITLTHLAGNPFANQCYGMKLINNRNFIPRENGIQDLGKEVINTLLNTKNGQRILIDVKHMSLKSRLQYYEMIKDQTPKIPIIVSHCGVTGVSMLNKPIHSYKINEDCVEVEYIKPEGLDRTEFNPWSINLYDEEIITIINSDGLMGIILEERILGCQEVDTEYFSVKEFENYKDVVDKKINAYKNQKKKIETLKNKNSNQHSSNQFDHLCNNILHIVKVGGEKAWDHICFGTDYDGMIDSIRHFKSSDKFDKMQRRLERRLPKLAKSDPSNNYYILNKQRHTDKNKVRNVVEKILFKNAERFLKTHFN